MGRLTLEDLGYTPDRYDVLKRWLVHERDQGGTLAFGTGIQGCGKTTMELHVAHASALQGETPIWRGRHVDSWPWFPGEVKVWANYPLELFRAPLGDAGGELEAWTDGAPRIHPFVDAEDIIERAEPGCLNVVYAEETYEGPYDEEKEERTVGHFWDDVILAAPRKRSTRWHHFIVDEMHELWWDRPQGEDYHRQARVRDALADFRKTFNSLTGASHQVDECDYRILAKFQFQLYGRGAKPLSKSRVNPALTLNLSQGAFIVDSLYFCELQLPPIPREPWQLFARRASEPAAAPALTASAKVTT